MSATRGEQLAQRFVDDELAPAERLELLELLARDDLLASRLRALERVAAAARAVPPVPTPPGLVQRVIDRLPPPNRFALWREALLRPRDLRWTPAQAFALALALVALAVVVRPLGILPDRRSDPALPTAPARVDRPEPSVLVRFVLSHTKAGSVAVAGDFNGWNPDRTRLKPVGGGTWAVTVPLRPGRYRYLYVVDGVEWVPDPSAGETAEDGFGAFNSVLDVES